MDCSAPHVSLAPTISCPGDTTSHVRPHVGADVRSFAWPTLALVRSVPAAALQGCLTDEHLRATARLVAEDARGQGFAAERLLVALKSAWAGWAEVRQLVGHDAQDLLDRLVSLCIRAYYRRDEWA
jgi:hypothetical protein